MIRKTRLSLVALSGAAALAAAALIAAPEAHAADSKLPATMVWSAYDLGSSGYADASAMADALMKKYSTRVRIRPSGTSIGRLLPITQGRVLYGFLGNEVFFATEATEDFADIEWGPQDLRIVLAKPSAIGLATAADAGIRTPADLKGKRIAFVKGNPSHNVKTDAFLYFAGLTRDDVEPVWFAAAGDMRKGVIANQVDAFAATPTSGWSREVEASPRGLYWPSFDASDAEGWGRVRAKLDFLKPAVVTSGAGFKEGQKVTMLGYHYPQLATYASTSDDAVYELVKALDETFDLYKDANKTIGQWEKSLSGKPAADAPWHNGAIRYLKEKGVWTAEDQAWNDGRLARMAKVQAAWDDAVAAFDKMRLSEREKGNKINQEEAWPQFWADYRLKQGF